MQPAQGIALDAEPDAPPGVAAPGIVERLVASCQELRGHRLPWLAVALGTGVGAYFALPVEPGLPAVAVMGCAAIGLAWLAWRARAGAGFLALMLATALAGLLAAQARSVVVAGPVLDWRYYGAIEGRVVAIDRSASDAPRLTLDRVRLDRMAPTDTPRRVRVSLHDETGVRPRPGMRVMTTGHLSPPSGPTEPGGFDFQRHAWFQSLGAIGYARVPLLQAAPEAGGMTLAVERARAAIGDALRARMDGQTGQVAVAITTGDRSGISAEVTEALRVSNLAHLLAISGLHMGLLVGFVFWAVRGGLALFPSIALRHPTRAWAAAAALPFALAYLFISGGSVATQRAFIMAVVMLGAVMLGRRALSIRSVAIAAILVLLWRPESLTGPGFQMSFAATAALVLAFRAASRDGQGRWLRGWRGAVFGLLLSSIVAGLATAPFAALHFNRLGQFGVLANMLAVPLMGTAVMPFILIGLLLMPLGLEGPFLMVAGLGIDWIVGVAFWVAALPGSAGAVHAPNWYVLPLVGLGMAIFGAARGRHARGAGLAAFAVAMAAWAASPRPGVLVSDDGRLVGVMGPDGRWLSRETGASFVATSWLENDGDMAAQAEAAARPQPRKPGLVLHHATTPSGVPAAVAACAAEPGWLVVPEAPESPVPPGCRLLGPDELARTGALALDVAASGDVAITAARDLQGDRPWRGSAAPSGD